MTADQPAAVPGQASEARDRLAAHAAFKRLARALPLGEFGGDETEPSYPLGVNAAEANAISDLLERATDRIAQVERDGAAKALTQIEEQLRREAAAYQISQYSRDVRLAAADGIAIHSAHLDLGVPAAGDAAEDDEVNRLAGLVHLAVLAFIGEHGDQPPPEGWSGDIHRQVARAFIRSTTVRSRIAEINNLKGGAKSLLRQIDVLVDERDAAVAALARVTRKVRALHIAGLIDNHATNSLLSAIDGTGDGGDDAAS